MRQPKSAARLFNMAWAARLVPVVPGSGIATLGWTGRLECPKLVEFRQSANGVVQLQDRRREI